MHHNLIACDMGCSISGHALNLFMKWIPEMQPVSNSKAGQFDLEAICGLLETESAVFSNTAPFLAK